MRISIHALLAESDYHRYRFQKQVLTFLSTLSLRRATFNLVINLVQGIGFLSTLSLRRATVQCAAVAHKTIISIHALLAESDAVPDLGKRDIGISIHALLAESDYAHAGNILPDQDFYPRSPCGERPVGGAIAADPIYFYPRSPCGERLRDGAVDAKRHAISIHALLAESDNRGRKTAVLRQYFYPRSPCGERPIFAVRPYDAPIFLSTLSLRRATWPH